MHKVRHIADGAIVWKGDAVVGVKGMTLPEIFYDCDCVKVPGNAFDYALAHGNEYTEEQLAFIDEAKAEWGDDE